MVGVPLPNAFYNNHITGTLEAALVTYSSNLIFAGNRAYATGGGMTGAFHLYRSHDIWLDANEVISATNGLQLLYSSNNRLSGNRVIDSAYGVSLYGSDGNRVEGNELLRNDENAVLQDSNGNTLTSNNLWAGERRAADTGNNLWQGNYWDDYTGADANGDGYGDVPYLLVEGGADARPRMEPWTMAAHPPPVAQQVPFVQLYQGGEAIHEDTVWENSARTLTGYVIVFPGATLTISSSTITAAPYSTGVDNAILVRPGAALHVYSSIIRGAPLDASFYIVIDHGGGLVIRNSRIEYAGYWGGQGGLQINGDGAVIENSVIVGNHIGIDTRGASGGHRFVGNQISECVDGIVLTESDSSLVQGNVISGCAFSGIYVGQSNGVQVLSNTVTSTALGVWVDSGAGTVVRGNVLRGNALGIYVWGAGHSFYLNRLDNGVFAPVWAFGCGQAMDDYGGNQWDNGAEGNYWSDYTGVDGNGDGIGDTPYVIPSRGVDRFPLMTADGE